MTASASASGHDAALNVVVTGGCGFLGQALIRALAARGRLAGADGIVQPIGRILAVDHVHHSGLVVDDRVEYVRGDIASETLMSHVMSGVTGSLFHLAATPGADLERDFDAGLRDLDAVRTLLAACQQQHRARRRVPRLVFASSFAVFGGGGAVDDRTRPAPRTGYGTRQAVTELLLAEASRRGFVDARSVRLPTVLVRPGGGEREFTGFASRILVEPLAGRPARCPVAEDCVLLVGALAAVVDALVQAHELEAGALPPERTVNLPASSVTVGAILDALAAVGGEEARGRVTIEPDPIIDAVLRGWPTRVVAERALELGFPALQVDLAMLVRSVSDR